MNTKDNFAISAFKMLLSIVALVIMLPMIDNLTDNSFYVTVSVYVLGKFIELVSKITERQLIVFYIIYIGGTIVGMLAVAMCFYAFANTDVSDGISNTITYNWILMGMTIAFCFIDIADFIYCICKLSYTKKKLQQFD
ncbi:MAG: hypothetical protein K2N34_11700 [Lachnospiraceae bacterium]|nr:hypothetical protein [Lachnospiraceae bacterium]